MSVEVKIVAENTSSLLKKLGEVAQTMTDPRALPDVSTMVSAINTQLPPGMECVILDHQESKTEKPKTKKKAAAKTAESAPDVPAEDAAEDPPVGSDDQRAFDDALDLLAQCYEQESGKRAVQALLTKHRAQKFNDIAISHGPDLLKAAKKIVADCAP